LLKYKKSKQFFLLLFVCLTSLIILYYFNSYGVTSVLDRRMEGFVSLDGSVTTRMEMVELGWKIFLDNPLVGCGLGCPRVLCLKSFNIDCYLHNDFIEILAGGGLVGFLLYYSIFPPVGLAIGKGLLSLRNTIPVDSLIVCFVNCILIFLFKMGSVTYNSTESILVSLPLFLCFGLLQQTKRN